MTKRRLVSGVGIAWSNIGFGDAVVAEVLKPGPPVVQVSAIVSRENKTSEGTVIHALQPAWDQIGKMLRNSPNDLYALSPEQWEELLAASYDEAGFDEVILTPRSGDFGREVIAVRRGWGSIRILDQMKAYKPGHVVPANDIRALLGVLQADHNATKAVMTTTSTFAPRVAEDPSIAPFCPYRLELVDGESLFERLKSQTSAREI